MSLKINKRQFKKWIAALDSGEYEQGQYHLQSIYGYCCLGVGCKVTIPAKRLVLDTRGNISGSMPSEQPLAPPWLKKITKDFYKKTGRNIDVLNDDDGFTFPEIATLLELVYIHKMLN
jgi:hypothetical protein